MNRKPRLGTHEPNATGILRDLRGGITLGGELHGNTPTAPGERAEAACGAGGQGTVHGGQSLLFSAGRSLRRGPSVAAYLGVQIVIAGRSVGRP
jgi:hypothetical protein